MPPAHEPDLSDASSRLAVEAAEGSEAAMREIYDRYSGLVHGLALRMLGDEHEAEEVTQDTFLKAWRGIASFDSGRSSLRGWLCIIARSKSLDRLRRRRVRPDQDKARVVCSPAESDFSDERASARLCPERHEALQRSLALLRVEYRSSLELAYFDGYTQREIAEILGIPEGTVKSFLRRGLQQLREIFVPA